MNIPVDIFLCHPDGILPEYKTPGSCAFDLSTIENATIAPGEIVRLRTGLVICTPQNHVLVVAARSSLPKKFGLTVVQGIGIVDEDYCGPNDEILLQLINFTNTPVTVTKGDRLAQGMIMPIIKASFNVVEMLEKPDRGGFGSTGH
ncbi:MAG: dUTP diphosphatase [Candidatus Uhrbacteria bacterium]|nr:dUTP diphosphatase [Candidatus Uhrbacteria bacterium]